MEKLSELDRFEATIKKLAAVLIKYIHYATEHRGYKSIPVAILDPVLNSVLSSYTPEKMLESFVRHSYPHWSQIQEGQTEFAREHMGELFPLIPKKHIPALLLLWDKYLDDKQKNILMKYLQAFVGISINYIHRRRGPILLEGHMAYSCNYFGTIWVRQNKCSIDSNCAGCPKCGVETPVRIAQAAAEWGIEFPKPPNAT